MSFRLNRPQFDALQQVRRKQTICLPWGRGVGKSWWLRWLCWMLIGRIDGKRLPGAPRTGIRFLWLMDTLKHFKDVHAARIEEELEGEWKWLGGDINRTTWRIEFPGGSWLQPFPAAEHTAKAGRGMRCDGIVADECDDIPISVFHSVAVPWFTEPWSYKLRVAAGTPRCGRYGLLYHLHSLGMRKDTVGPFRYYSRHATYRDAPEHVDREVVEDAREMTPPAIFRREWECDFDTAEGLVYSLFDEAHHVRIPETKVFAEYIVGVDWGFTDPGVYLLIGIEGHGEDAVCWVLHEEYATELVEDEWIDVAKSLAVRAQLPESAHLAVRRANWYADPSQPARVRSLGSKGQVKVQARPSKIEDGIAAVATRMKIREAERDGVKRSWSRLYVHPSCTNTLRELKAYKRKRDPKDRDRYLEQIVDKDNHACLVGETLVETEHGPVALRDIKPGNMVHTRRGLRRVADAALTQREAELWRLEMADGRVLEGTADHRIRHHGLIDSWRSMIDLCIGDWVGMRHGAAIVRSCGATGRRADVFNITVEDAHEYYANGVLVKNCDALRYAIFGRFGKPPVYREEWTANSYG